MSNLARSGTWLLVGACANEEGSCRPIACGELLGPFFYTGARSLHQGASPKSIFHQPVGKKA